MRLWILGVALVASAGCSSLPFEPAAFQNSGVPSPVVLATPVEGAMPLVPRAPDPAPSPEPSPEPAAPEPIVEEPAPPAVEAPEPPPIEGPCGAAPCAPPVVTTCPVGLVPVLGEVITCEVPPPTLTCPAGTQPVLRDTMRCEPV
jgi:hypothetical protein